MLCSLGVASILFMTGCGLNEADKNSNPSIAKEETSKEDPINKQVKEKEEKEAEQKNEEKEQKIETAKKTEEVDVEALQDEVNYYRVYVKEVSSLLDEEKKQALINKEWKYDATVNNVSVPSNGIVTIKDKTFTIVFEEEKEKCSDLPKEETDKERVSNTFESIFVLFYHFVLLSITITFLIEIIQWREK